MELRIKEAVWRFESVYASIFDSCHVADMNSWFHTATLAKLKTPIGSPDLREIHQLYTGQVPDMTTAPLARGSVVTRLDVIGLRDGLEVR